ncbi:MAG: asparagine synthase (glutamine-hydrolyzing) [Parvibaculales bacterium]
MCGFVTVVSPSASISDRLLAILRDKLIHRGPDAGANWIHSSGHLGMAHRRLTIIDKSEIANQPMQSDDNKQTLVFNGEIYNYIELREELTAKGVRFKTKSDTEVLLMALKYWGEGAIPKLNGMFSFCYWDDAKKQLLVVRDRFGEKPLFIGRGRMNTLIIASEMKAILAHPFVEVSTNENALSRFGKGAWYEDDELTFFDNVERLPPAHAIIFDAQGVEKKRWRYWTPDYTDIRDDMTPREAVGRFLELMEKSVKMRLRADVPVGSSLSGGLDSSIIVSLMAGMLQDEVSVQNTFSACFPDDPTLSEEKQIDAVIAHTDVASHKTYPDPSQLVEESQLLHWHQEEPFLSASIYLQWCVARLAKENDTAVMLDGQGADELLAGYQFHYKQRQLDLLDTGRTGYAFREANKFNHRMYETSLNYENASRRFNAQSAYRVEELKALNEAMPSVFHYDYNVGVAPAQEGFRLRRTISEALLYNSLPMLLRYADRNSMAFSREVRLPYLDHEFVEFCIQLPDDYYIRNGWQKWVMRAAAKNVIPESIRWRVDKVGYAAPLDHWLRDRLFHWARERLFDARLSQVEGYNVKELQKLWEDHQAEAANHSWILWKWISLSEWFELKDCSIWQSTRPSASMN